MKSRDDMSRASEHLDRADGHTAEAAAHALDGGHHAKEAMEAGAAGSALHALEAPVGAVVGKFAAKVGGWWNSARQAIRELPGEDRERYRAHFETYPNRPAGLTFDTALTAYALGHVAAENPAYRERDFTQIEPDIRHGFDEVGEQELEALSDFTKFSYEHVMTIRPSQDEDRVKFH